MNYDFRLSQCALEQHKHRMLSSTETSNVGGSKTLVPYVTQCQYSVSKVTEAKADDCVLRKSCASNDAARVVQSYEVVVAEVALAATIDEPRSIANCDSQQ